MPAASVSRNSTRRLVRRGPPACRGSGAGVVTRRCLTEEDRYSPTYGSRAMNRARLIALVTACWLAAVQPLLRRPMILA